MNPAPPRTGRRLGFREQIALLVALPLAVVLLAGVPLLATRVDVVRASVLEAGGERAALAVLPLLDALDAERAVLLTGAEPTRLLAAQASVRAAAAGARATLGFPAPPRVVAALDAPAQLDTVRAGAPPAAVVAAFRDVRTALVDAVLPSGARTDVARPGAAAPAASNVSTFEALMRAEDRRATVDAALLLALADPAQSAAAAEAAAVAEAAAGVLGQVITDPVTASAVTAVVAAPVQRRIAERVAQLRAAPSGATDEPRVGSAAAARRTASALPAEAAGEVAAAAGARQLLVHHVLARLTSEAGTATAVATAVAVGVGALLLAAATGVVVIGIRIGRSVSRPLQRLRVAADTVAYLAQAELSRRADTDAPAPALAAVNVPADDEIGDLAASFNRVQAVAALLLERQVVLRRNSAVMLGHVGRRTRSLVARQLDLLDQLESGEQDPQRLDRLYRLDHLTARLRRNADALLVLAEAGEHDLAEAPMPLLGVLRAALASIEGYQRVQIGDIADVAVAPAVRNDIALLIAELLENAVVYSPPSEPVALRATATGWGVRVEIVDRGVGMAAAELVARTRALREPQAPEEEPPPVLGLVVVGRIARRYGIVVTLHRSSPRPGPQGGTTAVVDLPAPLLVSKGRPAPPVPVDALTVTPPLGLPVLPVHATGSAVTVALNGAKHRGVGPTGPEHRDVRPTGPAEPTRPDPAPPDPAPPAPVPPAPGPVEDAASAGPRVAAVARRENAIRARQAAAAQRGAQPPRPLRRRTVGTASAPPSSSPPGSGVSRQQLIPPPLDAAASAIGELDRLGAAPTSAETDSSASVRNEHDQSRGLIAPPAGAAGLRRRVPGRGSEQAPPTPLLGVLTDAEAERAFVEQLEAGVARAVERVRQQAAQQGAIGAMSEEGR